MEENKTENESVSSKMKVLAIGGEEENSVEKPRPLQFTDEDCLSHLRYLLVGTRKPIEVVGDWSIVGRFGASVNYVNKIPKSYCFYYEKDPSYTPEVAEGSIISSGVISGREVMHELKKRLSNETWISENTISNPLKEKLDNVYHNRFCFIQQVVTEAVNTETKRLFNFLLFLHRENIK